MQALAHDLQAHLAAIESEMKRALVADELRVEHLIAELGSFHGKMLRPTLVLLVADAIGGIDPMHHRLGAALEMIHTATLIHDDLIDDSTTRRGQTTAHVRFGNTTSVLLGDYFYTHAFNLVASIGDIQAVQQLTATTNIVCRGELHQQCVARDVNLTEDEYNRIIYAKTAALCEIAAEFGAFRGTVEQRRAAAAYGKAAGMAFQIVDDCLDFSGDPKKVGKTLSTDIERGRLTLPIIRLLEHAGSKRAEYEQRLLNVNNDTDVAAVRALVIDGGGTTRALDTARAHVRDAHAALAAFPESPARQRLWELADFIISRDF